MKRKPGMNQPPTHKIALLKSFFIRWLATVLPVIEWLPAYKTAWFRPDCIAGITLAAYAVPVAMAYASLAGLPPQSGIYCYIFGGLVYALFASSRHLSIGPTAAISLMVAVSVGPIAGGDLSLYAAFASLTAGMVALMSIVAWLLRLSTLVNFISETILVGFKAGAAISIATTQLPKLFGLQVVGDNSIERFAGMVRHLDETNLTLFAIGISALVLLVVGERLFPGRPVALVVVAIFIIAVSAFDPVAYNLKVVGTLHQGLPIPGLASIGAGHIRQLLELAFACFILSYIESISAARTFAAKHNYTVDPRQELLGLGLANLATAFGQGYPVAGGLSQSAVNEKAGARTPLAIIIASLILAVVVVFLTGLLRNLPEVVLSAIVLVAVSGFVKISEFRRLWRISRVEFYVAMFAFVGVLLLGILQGVMISVIASLLLLLRLMAYPHVATLGRIPGTQRFSDIARHPDNELIPGVFLFRVEAAMLYFNVGNIGKTVIERVQASPTPVKLVVCDLSTSPYIDVAGAQMLAQLQEKLSAEGIRFRIAEAHAEVRDIIRASMESKRLGGVNRFTSIADIVNEFTAG
jgi:sulfate permease, SulP family